MSPSFQFMTAAKIICGAGRAAETGEHAATFGRRAALVLGRSAARRPRQWESTHASLARAGLAVEVVHGAAEPTIADVDALAETLRALKCDVVVGLGGGSVLDLAKAAAALATNAGSVRDYLDDVGTGATLRTDPLPFIALPTTAGTGTEVTKNAVIAVVDRRLKRSFRDDRLLPRVAIVDPALATTCPPAVTAGAGLDALTQLLEAFLSCRANVLTDALALDGTRSAARALLRAYEYPDDLAARGDMAYAALLSGLTLANAGLGAVHGLSPPLGAGFNIAHGMTCALLLPHVLRVNGRRIADAHTHPARPKLLAAHEALAGRVAATPSQAADGLVRWVLHARERLGIRTLSHYGVTPADFAWIISESRGGSSMAGNPVTLSDDDLREILYDAL